MSGNPEALDCVFVIGGHGSGTHEFVIPLIRHEPRTTQVEMVC